MQKLHSRGANWSVMFWSVSDSCSRAFRRFDSNCAAALGIERLASFWRLPRRCALLEPLCGVPKKRIAYVQVYMDCRCTIFVALRLAEYAKACLVVELETGYYFDVDLL